MSACPICFNNMLNVVIVVNYEITVRKSINSIKIVKL